MTVWRVMQGIRARSDIETPSVCGRLWIPPADGIRSQSDIPTALPYLTADKRVDRHRHVVGPFNPSGLSTQDCLAVASNIFDKPWPSKLVTRQTNPAVL
jgi:hypothetical protein